MKINLREVRRNVIGDILVDNEYRVMWKDGACILTVYNNGVATYADGCYYGRAIVNQGQAIDLARGCAWHYWRPA